MPACDTCRIRKVRCDRESPCGSCKISKFECTTSTRRPQAARQINLAVRNSKPPLAAIESKPTSETIAPKIRYGPIITSNYASKQVSDASQVTTNLGELPGISLVDSESVEFEADSSLNAYSIAARDLLVEELRKRSHVRDNPKMVAALSSLRRIVDADKVALSQKKPKLRGLVGSRSEIYNLTLPPTDGILEVLRKAKLQPTFVFSPPLAFVSRDQFNHHCKAVFFRTEDYPTSTAVIVHGMLESLLQELGWSEQDPALRQQYKDWAQLCRTNFEVSISSLDLLLPASLENAQALLISACYCMEIAQSSICKKITTHGCMMVRSLGWHRSSSTKHDTEAARQQKLVIFWMLYTVDKNLSLRLGQASSIQDCDIDLPTLKLDESAAFASMGRLGVWASVARVMDSAYQRLYSPGALKQTDAVRYQAVQQLLQDVEAIKPKPFEETDITQFTKDPELATNNYMRDATRLIVRSDEIIYHALLCMIYRATPTSVNSPYNPAVETIKSARAALDCHAECAASFKSQSEIWTMYLHWTILNNPFLPFTTLFTHVLTTYNQADLTRLQQFADSMSGSHTSQAAYKVSKLATVFANIATVYVELYEQELSAMTDGVQSAAVGSDQQLVSLEENLNEYPMPDWAPFSPFLDAFGFGDERSMTTQGASGEMASLENWFIGNQQIMGLLEDDLSFLDSMNLNF